ncbi:MAG: biopolymer transporter Tol [Candidatus Devosia phytovorans]|uniref:Biopolymer transporter Tol n=1 Tax=Candidatus Devosia phytovorans TaxID=3121372 RepID=A0AAJ6B3H7_9HYPH|nr:biopolymer transporter Tol [Devosia sp.]WEK06458.1 MAG: biopolymer transporter Tol [Devosia sp.]
MPFPFFRRGRHLSKGQVAQLTIVDLDGRQQVIHTADSVIEAPNWTPDGQWLVVNGGGRLYRLPVTGGTLEAIDSGVATRLNNDHVLSPDGRTAYVSSDDGHLYAVPLAGGVTRRISNDHATPHHYYLHGISPDGQTLAYVAVEEPAGKRMVNVFTIPAAGGPDRRLTEVSVPCDGPEYSPDGKWIYFNSELAASQPGHAQIFRMKVDGSGIEQLTFDDRVNWFPHVSPDGRHVAYLSYPEGTTGHPPDKDVELRLMSPEGGNNRLLATCFGGQGTINVNSWSPDSRRLAFVAYPRASARPG